MCTNTRATIHPMIHSDASPRFTGDLAPSSSLATRSMTHAQVDLLSDRYYSGVFSVPRPLILEIYTQ